MDNSIKEYYDRLKDLEYSEENIAKLFSIVLNLISDQNEIDNDRNTNKFLHYLLLTREKEFELFESAKKDQWENNFYEAKTNLLADMRHYDRLKK